VLFGELQGIDHAQHFVDVAAERQVIDHLVANDAVLVDQEGAAEGDAGGFELDVVGAADLVLDVGDQRVLHLADATVVDRGVLPGEVGELRVDRDADDFDAALLELVQAVIEGDQFGRADEGEVKRVEKDHRVLALGFRRASARISLLPMTAVAVKSGACLPTRTAMSFLLMRLRGLLIG
jgi:hypothetical protein